MSRRHGLARPLLSSVGRRDFIAQRRVELQREEYPSMEPGVPARRLYEDTDPFMFRGEFGGLLTRLGAGEITNVHADGSVCASVALAPR